MIGHCRGRLLLVVISVACGCSSSDAQRDGGGGQGQVGGHGGTGMTVVDAAADAAPGDADQSDVQVDRGSPGPADASPSSDGAPSTDGGGSCFPACIVDLGIPCTRTGQACVQTTSTTEAVSCFANGVKSRTTDSGTVVKKANGDLCFEYRGGGGQPREYFDAQGNFVARFEYTLSSTQFVIQCADGTTTSVDLTSPECASFTQTVCTQGQCTW